MDLLNHAKNIHSQTGEDGVLAKTLEILGVTKGWCVEFGAWDGEHLSNTCNLIRNHGFSAVLIEGDSERFKDLVARFTGKSNVIPMNCFVGFGSSDGLDKLLSTTPIPKDFDLLSIDIDGNDYHVWDSIVTYRPKIVCIEHNPTIPTEVDFVQPAKATVNQGASLKALARLGKQKGYELVAITPLNAIFVRAEDYSLFGISDNSVHALRKDTSAITHLFCGYDGTIFVSGSGRLHWHGIKYHGRIRQLPKYFRIFSGNYSPLQAKLYACYKGLLRKLGRG